MSNFLDKNGLTYLWGKITNKITTSISEISKEDIGLGNVSNDAQIPLSQKGAANGVATLGADGKVPMTQLPTIDNELFIVVTGTEKLQDTDEAVLATITEPNPNKIYLIKPYGSFTAVFPIPGETVTQNVYSEYVYINNTWEKIGEVSSDVDLSNCLTKDKSIIDQTGLSISVTEQNDDNIEITLEDDKGISYPFDINAATTSTAGVMSKNDKNKLDNTNVFFGTCVSAATATTKEVVVVPANFNLVRGSIIHVKFSYTNTTDGETTSGAIYGKEVYLNVSNTGKYPIRYDGSPIGTARVITSTDDAATNKFNILHIAGRSNTVISYVFDGTYYQFLGWGYNVDKSYNEATQTQAGLMSADDKKTIESLGSVYSKLGKFLGSEVSENQAIAESTLKQYIVKVLNKNSSWVDTSGSTVNINVIAETKDWVTLTVFFTALASASFGTTRYYAVSRGDTPASIVAPATFNVSTREFVFTITLLKSYVTNSSLSDLGFDEMY